MRSIPVDVSAFGGWMVVAPPEAKADMRTGEVKKDTATGLPLFNVGVVAIKGMDSDVLKIAVPGEPKGLMVGTAVRPVDLVVVPWEVEGRSGVSFKASAMEAVTPDSAGSGPGAVRRPVTGTAPARGGDAV